MGIVESRDLFDFDGYRRDLADAAANAALFAAATEATATRINSACAGVLSQITTLSTQISGMSLAPPRAAASLACA